MNPAASVDRRAWAQATLRSAAIVIAVLAAIEIGYFFFEPFGQRFFANDLNGYLEGARRFLDHGSPYLAEQLSGAWALQPDSFIHPPVALLLFIPFVFLPAVLWWAIPIGLTLWAIIRMRPATWAWPLMALCLLWPRTAGILIAGNSDMWVSAAIAVALAASLPTAVLLIMKPSYLPFALIGIPWRSWWVAGVAMGLAAAAFAGLWFDYVKVLRGVTLEPLYSLYNAPFVLMPVIAWLARTRRHAARTRIWLPRRAPAPAAEPGMGE
ncbi:MAG: hypothetical protein M3P84_08780 [Chloroflexota bacterium]|nr:hypothetical protein [Chloroflexota bacterium]